MCMMTEPVVSSELSFVLQHIHHLTVVLPLNLLTEVQMNSQLSLRLSLVEALIQHLVI